MEEISPSDILFQATFLYIVYLIRSLQMFCYRIFPLLYQDYKNWYALTLLAGAVVNKDSFQKQRNSYMM
jgi:hypothetical protein